MDAIFQSFGVLLLAIAIVIAVGGAILYAGYVQRRYGWTYGLPAYAVGVFVGYSRVHAKKHHTSDVLAASAIGVAANLILTRPYGRVTVAALPASGGPGVVLCVSW